MSHRVQDDEEIEEGELASDSDEQFASPPTAAKKARTDDKVIAVNEGRKSEAQAESAVKRDLLPVSTRQKERTAEPTPKKTSKTSEADAAATPPQPSSKSRESETPPQPSVTGQPFNKALTRLLYGTPDRHRKADDVSRLLSPLPPAAAKQLDSPSSSNSKASQSSSMSLPPPPPPPALLTSSSSASGSSQSQVAASPSVDTPVALRRGSGLSDTEQVSSDDEFESVKMEDTTTTPVSPIPLEHEDEQPSPPAAPSSASQLTATTTTASSTSSTTAGSSSCPHSNGASTTALTNGHAAAANDDGDDDDFDDLDVERMLEEPVKRELQQANSSQLRRRRPPPPVPPERVLTRRVLENRMGDMFELLPDGWVELTHQSGLPVYMHRSSRVCCLSRPYYIGPAKGGHHHVPLSAIPCMQARRQKQKQDAEAAAEIAPLTNGSGGSGVANGIDAPTDVKVQSVAELRQNLSADELHEYAQRLFTFKTIEVRRYTKWRDRRRFDKDGAIKPEPPESTNGAQLDEEEALDENLPSSSAADRPGLPADAMLITVPSMNRDIKPHDRPFVLNPQGKTSVAILHEYVQRVLRVNISYDVDETRNAATPYATTVKMAGRTHTKKQIRLPTNVQEIIARLRREQGLDKQPATAAEDGTANASGSSSQQQPQQQPSPNKGNSAGGSPRGGGRGRMHRGRYNRQNYNNNAGQTTGESPVFGEEKPEWITLGVGYGASKKISKLQCAKAALQVLVPGIEFNEDCTAKGSGTGGDGKGSAAQPNGSSNETVSLFNLLSLTDTRIPELSVKAGQPAPFIILQECLKRHSAFADTSLVTSVRKLRFNQHEFSMTIGEHTVRVTCVNKKEGKQKASQAMLARLNPAISTWGSLIALYGYDAQMKSRETHKKRDEVIRLQTEKSQPNAAGPNQSILDKLHSEMDVLFATPLEQRVSNQPATKLLQDMSSARQHSTLHPSSSSSSAPATNASANASSSSGARKRPWQQQQRGERAVS